MEVTLKIHRYNPETEHSGLETYTVQADETATLLDVLDVVKDEVDGSLSYRKSCRMAVCGSCGMRMNGAAVLAWQTALDNHRAQKIYDRIVARRSQWLDYDLPAAEEAG